MIDSTEYEAYLHAEWSLFEKERARQSQAVRATSGVDVGMVLDVGCGAGQEMIPFANAGAVCVGMDISQSSGRIGRRLFTKDHPQLCVHFVTSEAERLPFPTAAFDLVLCRIAVPYMDNRAALGEIGRVLRPAGILLLKTHHLRYYIREFVDGIRLRAPLSSVHALRVMLSGAIFHLTGWQPTGHVLIREAFLTSGRLKKELARAGLSIDCELPDSNRLAPSYRIVKSTPDGNPRRASTAS